MDKSGKRGVIKLRLADTRNSRTDRRATGEEAVVFIVSCLCLAVFAGAQPRWELVPEKKKGKKKEKKKGTGNKGRCSKVRWCEMV